MASKGQTKDPLDSKLATVMNAITALSEMDYDAGRKITALYRIATWSAGFVPDLQRSVVHPPPVPQDGDV